MAFIAPKLEGLVLCIPSAHDITSLYPVGIATIDLYRTLKERQAYLTRNGHTKPLSESSSRMSIELL